MTTRKAKRCDDDVRQLVARLVEEGHNRKSIASIVGFAPRTINKICLELGLFDKSRKISNSKIKYIEDSLRAGNYNVKEIAKKLDICQRCVTRTARRLGIITTKSYRAENVDAVINLAGQGYNRKEIRAITGLGGYVVDKICYINNISTRHCIRNKKGSV